MKIDKRFFLIQFEVLPTFDNKMFVQKFHNQKLMYLFCIHPLV